MKARDLIMQFAATRDQFSAGDAIAYLTSRGKPVARTYVSTLLTGLFREGLLARDGAGPSSVYALPEKADNLGKKLHVRYQNEGLEEYQVLVDLRSKKPFLENQRENVSSIFSYAFSEMMNNAIEHSESKTIDIDIAQRQNQLEFTIRDRGIGVFRNVMQKRGLASELEAIQDLLKGKATTAPQAHSGEGIFFTSKAGSLFVLESFGIRLRIDNEIEDIFVEEVKPVIKGTSVTFVIDTRTKQHLSDIFLPYQVDPEEPAFDKTEVHIKLYTRGTIYVSRSQARRVLADLTKFSAVTLDFDRVPTIGQAFADEIFRVFRSRHPEVAISAINTNKAVQFMIDRVAAPSA